MQQDAILKEKQAENGTKKLACEGYFLAYEFCRQHGMLNEAV